jgi:hypothetical protein
LQNGINIPLDAARNPQKKKTESKATKDEDEEEDVFD